MQIASCAKAWVALFVALLSAFAQSLPLIADGGWRGFIAVGGAFVTAAAVYLVANRLEGWNVFDLGRALLKAHHAKDRAEGAP